MTGPLARAILLSAFAVLAAGRAPAAEPDDALRARFRAALGRADEPPAPDDKALRGYLLYPYLEAARLRQALVRVPAGGRAAPLEKRVRAFLRHHGDQPVARDLRADWLRFLGARAQWADLLIWAEPEPSEIELRCYVLSARLARSEWAGLRDAALALWLTAREAPPACDSVFGWLDTPERLGDDPIEQRAIFAAQNRLPPPAAVARLPPPRRALMALWDRLMDRPEAELRRFAENEGRDIAGPDPDTAAALVEAFTRLARKDSKAAHRLYKPLKRLKLFDDGARDALQRALALGFAYDFDDEALALFRDLPEAALDAASREWRVRAALLHGQWRRAREWIEQMPQAQRDEPRWQYWLGRALERRHHGELARAAYERAAQAREYYAFLAAERLRREPDLRPLPLPDDRLLQAQIEARPALARARELFACGLPAAASEELRYGLRDDGADMRLQAARLLGAWGWLTPAQQLIAEAQQWDDLWLRFPLPYEEAIGAAARDAGLSGDWIYAVLRTESLYDPQAASTAGALGLLQLRLATARRVAVRAGLPQPDKGDLLKPEVSIALGARYLRELLDRFDGRYPPALAAYNAGPDRVPHWLPRRPVDGDVWVENIPYSETRTYVQRVLSAYVILGWRRAGEPHAILPLLRPVGGSRQDASP